MVLGSRFSVVSSLFSVLGFLHGTSCLPLPTSNFLTISIEKTLVKKGLFFIYKLVKRFYICTPQKGKGSLILLDTMFNKIILKIV
jgi:hypothetical protein